MVELSNFIEILDAGVAGDLLKFISTPKKISASDYDRRICFGFDANVILRLSQNTNLELIIDYFGVNRGTKDLVLPSQALIEFHNNEVYVEDTLNKSIRKKLDELKKVTSKVKAVNFSAYGKIEELIKEFERENSFLFDDAYSSKKQKMFSSLKEIAVVSRIPRGSLGEIARSRKVRKFPPGFMDEGDGDFYCWVEFIYHAYIEKIYREKYEALVWVTNDVKVDWSRGGYPHPALAAECFAATGGDFFLCTLDELVRFCDRKIN
ncbi:PIN-like domain-containing protein [Paracidovorax avenae]|uniref:PIN-like domain-containing protein n=1 Tax=Paracidovorax avenae TaxID=80867 RepID=UPI000FE18988|nr:PIN-like domain-containing protein [Paracidovorax avenae]